MPPSRRILIPLAVVAVTAATATSAVGAVRAPDNLPAPRPDARVVAKGGATRPAHKVSRQDLARLRAKAHGVRRLHGYANAWGGTAGSMCIGTSLVTSIGRDIGLAPGTQFSWRSRLWVYNPRTGASYWTGYSGWFNDRVTPGSYYVNNPDGTVTFVMGPSGGINPGYSPTSVWTVTGGLWVVPYVQINGVGERPVNVTDVDYGSRFSAPNWCWFG